MKKHLFTLLLILSGFYVSAQTPTLTLAIADANMLPNIKPSSAHFKVDRVYGQNLQSEYYFVYGTPTSPLSPFLASLHFNITSTYVDPATGIPVVGYWTTEKVYSAFINTIDFSKSMNGLYTLADAQKSDSTRIATDSVRLSNYQSTVTTALSSKFNNPTGTSSQYINGQGNSVSFSWLNDSVIVIGDARWVKLAGTYSNPSFVNTLAASKVTGLANVATSGDYNDLSNKPVLSSYLPSSTAASTYYPLTNPSGYISSVPAQSFASLTGKPTTLAGYGITDGVLNTRTLTINGTAFDLSANRSWTVGDVTSASLSSTLSSYVLTSTYTAGLANKQNTLSLTTTGSGAATLVGSTLNIPTPVVNTYTAGTGIGIASNVITNTAPDQVVTLTGGTGISITGAYPSFTATNTAPYVAPVITTPTLVLGTTYQAPVNKNVWVNASITHTIALTLLISSGSSLVQLQTSPNGTTWTNINRAGYSDGVAVAVALTKTVTNNVCGEVPQGYYYRLLATTSGAGTAAITDQQVKTY